MLMSAYITCSIRAYKVTPGVYIVSDWNSQYHFVVRKLEIKVTGKPRHLMRNNWWLVVLSYIICENMPPTIPRIKNLRIYKVKGQSQEAVKSWTRQMY